MNAGEQAKTVGFQMYIRSNRFLRYLQYYKNKGTNEYGVVHFEEV